MLELTEEQKTEIAAYYSDRYGDLIKSLMLAVSELTRERDRAGLVFLIETIRALFLHSESRLKDLDTPTPDRFNGWGDVIGKA